MTINATILGGHYDHSGCTLILMDDDGQVSEMVLIPDMAVLPDEALIQPSFAEPDVPPMQMVDYKGNEFQL
jgi:hypothetical protein